MQTIITRATAPKIIRPAMEKLGVSGLATKTLEQVDFHFRHAARTKETIYRCRSKVSGGAIREWYPRPAIDDTKDVLSTF
jgi:hypothetical protein